MRCSTSVQYFSKSFLPLICETRCSGRLYIVLTLDFLSVCSAKNMYADVMLVLPPYLVTDILSFDVFNGRYTPSFALSALVIVAFVNPPCPCIVLVIVITVFLFITLFTVCIVAASGFVLSVIQAILSSLITLKSYIRLRLYSDFFFRYSSLMYHIGEAVNLVYHTFPTTILRYASLAR